jgi:protein involved in polysaccharide export with SLBB domain
LFALADVVQAQTTIGAHRRQASRSELSDAADLTEKAATVAPDEKTKEKLLSDASAIRQRLRNGDFLPGDRIFIEVLEDSSLTDTFTVRGDRKLQLPNLPDISLLGVLDSELGTHLTTEIGKFVKTPTVRATGLLRVALMGGVGNPGYYTVQIDRAITDVLMLAGGPASGAKLNDAVVKRQDKTVIDKKGLQVAIQQNKTVGDISLRDGDEIYIPMPAQNNSNWLNNIRNVTAVISIIALIAYGGRFGRGRRP